MKDDRSEIDQIRSMKGERSQKKRKGKHGRPIIEEKRIPTQVYMDTEEKAICKKMAKARRKTISGYFKQLMIEDYDAFMKTEG